MASFTTTESQHLIVTFQLKQLMAFPNQYEDEDYDDYLNRIAEAIVYECNGDVINWEINEADECSEDGTLLPNTPYVMDIACAVSISGSCYYDSGRYCGPMEDCYPEEIDDVEYEDGMIDSCSIDKVLAIFDELASLSVDIGEVSSDGDIEIDDNY